MVVFRTENKFFIFPRGRVVAAALAYPFCLCLHELLADHQGKNLQFFLCYLCFLWTTCRLSLETSTDCLHLIASYLLKKSHRQCDSYLLSLVSALALVP